MSWLLDLTFPMRRVRRRCFHHNHHTGESWVTGRIIDDARKVWSCSRCGRRWIL